MKEKINTLHKYYIWANKMRTHFDETIEAYIKEKVEKKTFQIEADMYMSLWYGILFVVIEGWNELNIQDAIINELSKSEYVDLLKRYRHGVFHFQADDNDSRFVDFFEKDGSADWARNIHKELGRWFVEFYKSG